MCLFEFWNSLSTHSCYICKFVWAWFLYGFLIEWDQFSLVRDLMFSNSNDPSLGRVIVCKINCYKIPMSCCEKNYEIILFFFTVYIGPIFYSVFNSWEFNALPLSRGMIHQYHQIVFFWIIWLPSHHSIKSDYCKVGFSSTIILFVTLHWQSQARIKKGLVIPTGDVTSQKGELHCSTDHIYMPMTPLNIFNINTWKIWHLC